MDRGCVTVRASNGAPHVRCCQTVAAAPPGCGGRDRSAVSLKPADRRPWRTTRLADDTPGGRQPWLRRLDRVAERERDLLTDIDRSASIRDHLANERTLLAWQRTALALIGLGFVVDRFAFEGRADAATGNLLGLAMIAGGGVTAVVGAWRFVQTERQIDSHSYQPALFAHLVLAGAITAGAILTGIYLILAR